MKPQAAGVAIPEEKLLRRSGPRRGWRVAIVLLLLAAGGQILVRSQAAKPQPIDNIELVKVVTLQDRTGQLPVSSFSVIPAGDGFLVVARKRDRVLVFDRGGRLRTTLTTPQGKPFAVVGAILPAGGGSFVVHDARAGLLYPVSRDLKVGEPIALTLNPSLAMATGDFVVAEQIRSTALAGFPVHLIDRSGRIVRSFGTENPELGSDTRLLTDRIVGKGLGETIWSAPPGRYVLEKWAPRSGTRLARVPVRSTWFQESGRIPTDENIRPGPILLTLWEDRECLWVLIRDADLLWKPPAAPNIERPFDVIRHGQAYDWILEAVNPLTGEVLASMRSKEPVWGRSPSPYFVISSQDAPAEYDVVRPQLNNKVRRMP